MSPATTEITGYTPEEFYADPGPAQRVVHPDDRAAMEDIPQGENVDQVFSCCRTP
ncbi:MAG: PAS domain-containing protein [Frankiaceae bacterium]